MNITTPRDSCAVAVSNDILYALGGYHNGFLATNEAYYPASVSVPEFPAWIALPGTVIVTLFVTIASRNKKMVSKTTTEDS
jgi:hypothetical protein